jgi:tetratricopeptide (TPR) repeat protein
MMLPLILAAASPEVAVSAPSQTEETKRFVACLSLVDSNPLKAVEEASIWRITGGGVLARQCLGLGYAAQQKWASAQAAFEQAALLAERGKDGRSGRLWMQAGNAALAGGDANKARGCFDAALIGGTLSGPEKGELHLDRARALVALTQVVPARIDLDEALKLVPEDPLGWLLSATLARRSGDLKRAQSDIAQAVKRAPDDAQIALEAGNIALLQGQDEVARKYWEIAVKLTPDSPAGKSAATALAHLGYIPGK